MEIARRLAVRMRPERQPYLMHLHGCYLEKIAWKCEIQYSSVDKDGKMIDNLEITVEAVISIDSEEYALKKVQKQKWVKKRGTNTTEFQGNVNEFEINGYPKSEKEFKEFISGIIDEKIFNLITNPVAFTSLPWKEQRRNLNAVC